MGDESDGKPRAKRNKVLKSNTNLPVTKKHKKDNTNSPVTKKHKKDNNKDLIEALIKQQAEAKEQSRRVELKELLNANKKHNIRKSKRIVEEDNEENDSVEQTLLEDNNYNNKHNIRKSKRNEVAEDNETEEEESAEEDDEEVDDHDDVPDKKTNYNKE